MSTTTAPSRSTAIDDTRPFGAHVRMRWWKPLLIIPFVPVSLLVLQLASFFAIQLITGDPVDGPFSPEKLLAVNLTTGLAAVLAVAIAARLAGIPWRRLLSSPRRFLPSRAFAYAGIFVLVAGAGVAVTGLVAPEAPGWSPFVASSTVIALLVVMLLTTPIQTAAEELLFRGVIIPAAASWFRHARLAMLVGLVVSGLAFAISHVAVNPWLFAYYMVMSICTGLMGVASRGLEAAIGFHLANNMVTTTINTIFSEGRGFALDRGVDSAGPELIAIMAMNVAALAIVWIVERRRATA